MGFLQKLKRFSIRFLIYQIILLWAVTKIGNVEKHGTDFKNKILTVLNLTFGVNSKELGTILDDPTYLFCYCCLEIIAAILGIFGSYYGHIVSAFLFLITNLIYFNPVIPDYNVSLLNTRMELFYNIAILLALLLMAYYPHETESKDSKVAAAEIEEEEDDEQEQEA